MCCETWGATNLRQKAKKAMSIDDIVKIIEESFNDGKVKQVRFKRMIRKLKKKGYGQFDIDDALDEAKRRKIVKLDSGFYRWIDPSLREAEKAKTRQHHDILGDIFKQGEFHFLPEEDVKLALIEKGFVNDEIDDIFIEAERDHVLDFCSNTLRPRGKLVAGCVWIPPEERLMHAEADRHDREWSLKWIEKKIMQEEHIAKEEIKDMRESFSYFKERLLAALEDMDLHNIMWPVPKKLEWPERVNCYELYHQLRRKLKIDFPFLLDGEVDGKGHLVVRPNLGSRKPDFLVHIPSGLYLVTMKV